jgi:hypothetical protein
LKFEHSHIPPTCPHLCQLLTHQMEESTEGCPPLDALWGDMPASPKRHGGSM